MKNSTISNMLKRTANYWPSFLSKKQKQPRLAAVISFSDNYWALRALNGIKTYFLNSSVPLEHAPIIEPVAQSSTNLNEFFENYASRYDGVITVGTRATLETKGILTHLGFSSLPILACGIKDPIGTGLVDNMYRHNENIGIVSGHGYNHFERVEAFLALRPKVRKVALIHYVGGLSDESQAVEVSEVKKAFEDHDVDVLVRQVSTQKDIFQKQLYDIARKAEVICTFRDILLQENLDALIKICTEFDVTLFASELASVVAGAAVGFGTTGHEYGERLGALIEEHFYFDRAVSSLPVAFIREPAQLRVNNKTFGRQGIRFDRRTYLLMSSTELLYRE